ncbi:MAG: DMT family transporter [Nitrospinota bacterium]
MPIYWALMAALSFSVGQVLVSRGLPYSNATTAAWFTSGASGLILWLISLTRPFPPLTLKVVLAISAAALFSPFLARLSLYMGFARLGVSRPTVVVGMSPLFAAVLAILFLGEPWTFTIGLGTVATTAGVVLLVYQKLPWSDWKKIHLVFPLFAAFCFGARDVVARFGVKDFASPVVAAAIAPTVAWLLMSPIFYVGTGEYRFHLTGKAVPLFCSAGIFYVIAYFSLFSALSGEYVVIVAPAMHSSPLFTLILSYLFLRKEEKPNAQLILGAVFVVLGVTIISLARKGI